MGCKSRSGKRPRAMAGGGSSSSPTGPGSQACHTHGVAEPPTVQQWSRPQYQGMPANEGHCLTPCGFMSGGGGAAVRTAGGNLPLLPSKMRVQAVMHVTHFAVTSPSSCP